MRNEATSRRHADKPVPVAQTDALKPLVTTRAPSLEEHEVFGRIKIIFALIVDNADVLIWPRSRQAVSDRSRDR